MIMIDNDDNVMQEGHIPGEVVDLYQDLRDGKVLRCVCSRLSGVELPPLPPGVNGAKHLNSTITFLKKEVSHYHVP